MDDARAITSHAERMQARMFEVAEGDLTKRYNGCDCWIRRYLVNHFGAVPNGAYEDAMAAVRLPRGYGTDSHRFKDGSGTIWTWDEDGKGDQLAVWATRADMDREIDEAVGEVTRELRAFNGFWGWEMERRDRLGEPTRPAIMEVADEVTKQAHALIKDGHWLGISSIVYRNGGEGRGEVARAMWARNLAVLEQINMPKGRGEIGRSKRSFLPWPVQKDAAPEVQAVHGTIAAQTAWLNYAEVLTARTTEYGKQAEEDAALERIHFYVAMPAAMGLGRP